MRVALLHHWFLRRGGGERVVECLAALLPSAELYALLSRNNALPRSFAERRVRTSWLQQLPWAAHLNGRLLPLYPAATRLLDLRAYDFVLSSDTAVIKGAQKRKDAVHICYCHSPMRCLYDGFQLHQRDLGAAARRIFRASVPALRRFDRGAVKSVDGFLTNSYYVAERIQRLYGRESTVIYPPIDMSRARRNTPGDHYLCVGELLSYKRTEMMVMVCEKLGRKLRIVGTGPEMKKLQKLAGPNTTFLGDLPDEELWDEYSRCRALLFAADEDFGMIPLEVQACGRPVIAFGFGGSLETVRGENPPTRYAPQDPVDDELARAHPTGMYFTPQTPIALLHAVQRFEQEEHRFDPATAQAFAAQFDTPVFLGAVRDYLLEHVPGIASELAPVEGAMQTLARGLPVQ